MELTALRQFIEVARTGHLTRAAAGLGVTQPALSAMLKKLQAEVGAPLVDRTAKGVELTEAGRVFLEYARDAVRRADAGVEAVRELTGLGRGSIRIGGGATATTYLLPSAVSVVRALHPGLRFYIREAGSSAVSAAVLSGELDLGIVTLPVTAGQSAELAITPLVDDELRLIVPRKSDRGTNATGKRAARGADRLDAVRSGSTFAWKDLAGVPVVAFEAGTAVRLLIDQAAAAAGIELDVVMELRSIESIKRMVGAGVGVGFVSRFAIESAGTVAERGGKGSGVLAEPLVGLPCRDGRLTRRLAVVKRRDRTLSPGAAAFERSLTASLRERAKG